jgi:hypothetical protein
MSISVTACARAGAPIFHKELSIMSKAVLVLFSGALALSLAGCPEVSEPAADAGAAPAADSGPATLPDAGGEAPDAGPAVPEDRCLNAADTAAAQGVYGDDEETAGDIAGRCGKSCLLSGAPDQEACTVACMTEAMGGAMSESCSGCYYASVACAADNCLAACLSGTDEECLACRCGGNPNAVNCFDVFTACSGIPSTSCD